MDRIRQREDPLKSLVGFYVGDVHYALTISEVREIIHPLPLTPLPQADPSVIGVSDVRGEVIPVIDLRVRFGLESSSAKRKWLVVRLPRTAAALVVDRVTDVFAGGEELQRPPEVGGQHRLRGIRGVAHVGEKLLFVLDVASLHGLVQRLSERPGALRESGT